MKNFSEELLQKIETFPCLPHAVIDIIRSTNDDNMEVNDLVKIIDSDLGMLTSVLKLANSARYNSFGKVASTQRAIMLLGSNTIRHLALLGGTSAHLKKTCGKGLDFNKFMSHSIGVACCAKHLAKRCNENQDVAFISGLLHDIGQLFLAGYMPVEMVEINNYQKEHNCHASIAETEILGVNHAWIGSQMTKAWLFPAAISDGIEHHHAAQYMHPTKIADIIHVAEVLSHALDLGSLGIVPPLAPNALTRLNITFNSLLPDFSAIEDEHTCLAHDLSYS